MKKNISKCAKINFFFKLAKSFIILFVIFIFSSCSVDKKTTKRELLLHSRASKIQSSIQEDKIAKRSAVENFVNSLSEEEKISHLFLINLEGKKTFTPVERTSDIYKNRKQTSQKKSSEDKALIPGGYIFFSYNFASTPKEIISFTSSIKEYCKKNNLVPPYLSLDQEGGEVNRLRGITSVLPSNKRVAQCLSPEKARQLYSLQSIQIKNLGFNMNIAPVSEICTDDNKNFLSGRSYGNRKQVLSYASAAVRAYEENKIGTVLKHFPGNTNTDPHTGLPEIDLSSEELESLSVEPFSLLINYSPSAVLMSHARTLAHDKNTPADLSRCWVSQKLIDEMNFTGLVICDDIFMAALEKNGFPPEEASVKAIEAGVDVIMISEKRFANVAEVLLEKSAEDEIFKEKLFNAECKVIEYKIKAGILENKKISVDEEPLKYEVKVAEEKEMPINEKIKSFENAKEEGNLLYEKYFHGVKR